MSERYIRGRTRTKECPLSFHGWLVYSLLTSYDKPVACETARITRDLGLSKEGAYAARKELRHHHLLDDKCRPAEAPPDWFHTRGRAEGEEGEGLAWAYIQIGLPAENCPVPLNVLVTACIQRSFWKTGRRLVGAGTVVSLTGVSKNTAGKVLKELRAMGVITETEFVGIPQGWVRPKPQKKTKWAEMSAADRAEVTLKRCLAKAGADDWQNYVAEYAVPPACWNDPPTGQTVTDDHRKSALLKLREVASTLCRAEYQFGTVFGWLMDILKFGTGGGWTAVLVAAIKAQKVVESMHAPQLGPDFPLLSDGKQRAARASTAYEFGKRYKQCLANLGASWKKSGYAKSYWFNLGEV